MEDQGKKIRMLLVPLGLALGSLEGVSGIWHVEVIHLSMASHIIILHIKYT